MAILKKPYEISLWEDVLTFVVETTDELGNIFIDKYEESLPSEFYGKVLTQYYQEKKICVIGSDIMDSPIRATQGKIVSNINGTVTFTFNMYSYYWDEEIEDFVPNPFIELLVNERKIKVRYGEYGANDTKWYDLVIKNVSKNSETKTNTYTAKSLFVNELSKSGFNIILDNKLENNMGSAVELTKTVLDGSDWRLKEEDFTLEQTVDEPLYKIVLDKQITGIDMRDPKNTITISQGEIYAFYSEIEAENSYLQFLYVNGEYETNDDSVIINSPNYYIENVKYKDGKPDFANVLEVSGKYRGSRIVRKIETEFDSKINKYVNVYEDKSGNKIYGFTETEYASPATTRSFITNPDFSDGYTGWEIGAVAAEILEDDVESQQSIEAGVTTITLFPEIEFVSVPDIRDVEDFLNTDFTSCLRFKATADGQWLYNRGIIDHRHEIDSFVKDEEYFFRIKYSQAKEFSPAGRAFSLEPTDINLKFCVANYELVEGQYKIDQDKIYFEGAVEGSAVNSQGKLDYSETKVTCKHSLSYKEMITMSESLGFFIQADESQDVSIYIEDVWFFPYVQKADGNVLLPDEISEGEVKTVYYYYDSNDSYESLDEINFLYKGYEQADYSPAYVKNYEKIRSITASESNRFNLLQEICETFECWMDFEIDHEADGTIVLDKDYKQAKWVKLRDYSIIDNYAGFKYGINLKSIQRSIDSDGIVTKLIVKDNSNEFAPNGFCSVARAMDNPSGENFLLDFSYYIQQEMLSQAAITNDLYLDADGYIGYYKKLKQINKQRDILIEESANLQSDIMNYEATYETYRLSVSEAEEQQRDDILILKQLTSYDFETLMANRIPEGVEESTLNEIQQWWRNEKALSLMTSIAHLKSTIAKYQKLRNAAKENLDSARLRFEEINRILTSDKPSENEEPRLLIEKNKLNEKFYQKYSRFLQEGSWISEDYIDDNLYFLDAQSTLHTSGQPKVTYNINVLEISRLEGYENYTFALGNKTTVEDTEFFGWVDKEGVRTPYKEEIVVTELTVMLDSPEQNQIKVQNYKTQFEDLFQRIAATTQSVEYSTGQYNKASSIVETDGTIKPDTLQNSVANNALTLQNAKEQTVVWDESGITATSLTNPSELVRIVNRGIYLSTDGGITWTTGVTGKGINANLITAGQVNTNKIEIMNGDFPSFRWDANGISAYEFKQINNQPANFNYSKYVRLDQYGLYGINDINNFIPGKEQDIWDNAHFALTWKGFMLKNDNGSVEISSVNDIQVKAGDKERIKIGRLTSDTSPIYGIRISDADGAPVMETNSDGKLWIKNELKVGNGKDSTVSIGYLDKTRAGTEYHEVIHAGSNEENSDQKFIVYEDGKMVASGGEFTGKIYATGGTIGGVEIEELSLGYEVRITSSEGAVFTEDGQVKTLVATLYKGATAIMQNVQYQWYKNGIKLENEISNTLKIVLTENSINGDGIDQLGAESATYSCEAKEIKSSNE